MNAQLIMRMTCGIVGQPHQEVNASCSNRDGEEMTLDLSMEIKTSLDIAVSIIEGIKVEVGGRRGSWRLRIPDNNGLLIVEADPSLRRMQI